MSQIEAPPLPAPDPPDPPRSGSRGATSTSVGAPAPPVAQREPVLHYRLVVPSAIRQLLGRLGIRLGKFVGRSTWLIVRWVATVALVGAAVAAAAMVVVKAVDYITEH